MQNKLKMEDKIKVEIPNIKNLNEIEVGSKPKTHKLWIQLMGEKENYSTYKIKDAESKL